MAETFTDKLKLSKRDTGDLNWGAGHNANMDVLDAHHQQSTLRPPRTLLASLGSGAVGANLSGASTYFFKVTAFNAAGETTECFVPSIVEAQIVEPTTPVPIILQWETVKGASGYRIYKGTTSGQEKLLTEVTGESTLTYTDAGSVASNPAISIPTQNTARTSVKKIIAGTGISVDPADGTGDVTISSTATGGVSSLKKTGAAGLQGDVALEEGAGVQLTQDDANKKILIANVGVTGVRKLGDASPLTGDVKLEAGTNITLTTDAPNNKITIAAAGGGASGYVTQVVAAPTGVAATDTSNIQTALTNAGNAGGGIVQLREGSYLINNTLTIPAKVTLQGQGRDATIILCDASMGAVNTIAASGNSQGLRDLKIDENYPGRTGGSPFVGVYLSGTNALVENCWFVRNKSSGSWIYLSTGGQMRNCIIDNTGNGLSTAMVQGGELIDNCQLTQNQNNGSVNDFMQQPGRVMNCRLVRTMGTLSGAGIRMSTSQMAAVGNMISVSSPNKAIIIGSGSTGCMAVGNVSNGATILLETNVNSAVVVGNVLVVVTNNSGTGTNQIANNS